MADNLSFWDDCYAEGKTGWDRGEVHPALKQWLETGLLKPCTIIVPGCGRGYEVVELAKQGFHVTAVDFAAEPVRHVQRQLQPYPKTSQVVQESIFDYRPVQPVDVVYEQTCLCAIDPQLRTQYEQAVFNWLKPNGRLFILFAQTESPKGPPYGCDIEEMESTFLESRWQWPSDPPQQFSHPSGKLHELAYILKRKL